MTEENQDSSEHQSEPPPGSNPYEAPGAEIPTGIPPQGGAYAAGETTADERTWGLLAHLSWIAGSIIGFPVLGPLVVWLIKKDESPFIETEAKEALNFQITVFIAALICIPLAFICIGFFLLIGLSVAALIYSILAAVAANKGQHYRYPSFIFRFVK